MKTPALQDAVIAHLRGSTAPVPSRELASRFLKIGGADEATCRRLLAPLLDGLRGVIHRDGAGWSWEAGAVGRPGAAAPANPRPSEVPPRRAADEPGRAGAAPLHDFLALASEGGGPGGSGTLRAVSLLPCLEGEPLQEEHFPAWAADGDAPETRGRAAPGLAAADLQSILEAIGDLPVVCHRVGREIDPLRRACAAAGLVLPVPVLSAAKLGHLLLGLKANHATLDLATALGVEARGPDDCRGRVRLVAACFLGMIPLLQARGIDSVDTLLEFQDMPAAPLDLSGYAFTADDLRSLPAAPGVYRFLDRRGDVIYVGKSKNLRSRVGSYFVPGARAGAKGRAILEQVHSLVVERVASELEAILLESALLLEHRPRLNRQFEVHERSAPYGPRLDLVVVLADPDGGVASCTLHLLRQGRYLGRVAGVIAPERGASHRESDAASPWSRALDRIRVCYFGGAGGADGGGVDGEQGSPTATEYDWQLAGSYLRAHRDEVNVLDIDECAGLDEAAARLRVLLAAAAAGAGRVVAR
jgi:GIY-YIG catalytic domain